MLFPASLRLTPEIAPKRRERRGTSGGPQRRVVLVREPSATFLRRFHMPKPVFNRAHWGFLAPRSAVQDCRQQAAAENEEDRKGDRFQHCYLRSPIPMRSLSKLLFKSCLRLVAEGFRCRPCFLAGVKAVLFSLGGLANHSAYRREIFDPVVELYGNRSTLACRQDP